MSSGPEIRTHPLARGGTLEAALLEAEGTASSLFPAEALEQPGEGLDRGRVCRLPISAFGTAGASAESRLERVMEGEGVVVSAGQQPYLFLGPLYVLYKALSALDLARRIEESTGRPALALFWVASDDHDWDEVGATRLLDVGNRLRELRLEPPPGWARRSAGPAPLPASVVGVLDEFERLLPDTEFVGEAIGSLREAWRPSRPVGEAFAHTLAAVIGDRPLAWVDAASTDLKAASAPLFETALREPEEGRAALEAGARRIRAQGFDPPIPVPDGATHLFYDDGDRRRRLYREGDRVVIGRDGRLRALEDLLDELAADPHRFGPNVALRPVLESWLLPVAATVLGPGELAYWSQLRDLFERYGTRMPAVRPRHAWLLLEAKVAKVIDKLGEEPAAFSDGGAELTRRAIELSRPAAVDRALRRCRATLDRGMGEVEKAIAEHLPGIRSAAGKARSQAFDAVAELESQVDGRVRERREVLLGQIRKAAVHLFPDGRPQERRQSPFYYLARYGPGLVDTLASRTREIAPPLWEPD